MSKPFKSFKGEYRSNKSSATVVAAIKAHWSQIIMEMAADPMYTLEVVGAGPDFFRRAMQEAFAPYPLPDEAITGGFRFLCQRVLTHFKTSEFSTDASAYTVAKTTLDRVEEVSPPTDDEIRRAWKVEDFSSPDGLKAIYGKDDPGAPMEHLEALLKRDDDGPTTH